MVDNCSIHKSEEIEQRITQAGASLIHLPPYSPEFSPIQNCWSKVKSVLRSIGARTYSDSVEAIEQAFNQVSSEDIRGWFILLSLHLTSIENAIKHHHKPL